MSQIPSITEEYSSAAEHIHGVDNLTPILWISRPALIF